ncbi:MAG: glycosyltransferase [Xanthomonadaceae bacterium]|nr:glycosyltransferase [Rhodospirillaceae bacterium]NIA18070.1 glycosyltransferase [Xanthomonadaceae bacterium]
MTKISINLLTYNGEKYLKNCFNSILGQNYKNFALLVIDNNSSDNSVEIIKKFETKFAEKQINFRFIQNKENLGFAKGHNQAIKLSNSKYVLVLNQDLILDKNYLKKMIDFMGSHPKCGSATGKILRLTNGQKTDIIDSLGIKILRNFRAVDSESGKKDNNKIINNQKIFGVSATCPLYRRKALESIKIDQDYFDSDFHSYKEDIDLAFRLKKVGWKSYLIPDAKAWHNRTASGNEQNKNFEIIKNRKQKSNFINYNSYKNHLFVLVKNITLSDLFKNFPFIFWYEFKKFIYIILFEPKSLKALREFFKKLPKMIKKRKIIMK